MTFDELTVTIIGLTRVALRTRTTGGTPEQWEASRNKAKVAIVAAGWTKDAWCAELHRRAVLKEWPAVYPLCDDCSP